MLASLPGGPVTDDLIVGNSTCDDAAVLRIDGSRALVQTVDFFTPIVDDPGLFGEIAAANAVSDIYAMGATPAIALALAMFPKGVLPLEVLTEILAGGERKAREAGFVIAGGHTMIDDVPKYGLAVTGFVEIDELVRNSTAQPGDAIYITKPIGNGTLVAAYRAAVAASKTAPPGFDAAVEWMCRLNRDAALAMTAVGVSAATDVTGYGLIGHLLEVCEASRVGARIISSDVPVLEGVRDYVRKGVAPGGTVRNEDAFRDRVEINDEEDYRILCDAQTSGGLLIFVETEKESTLRDRFERLGVFHRRIGEISSDEGRIALK